MKIFCLNGLRSNNGQAAGRGLYALFLFLFLAFCVFTVLDLPYGVAAGEECDCSSASVNMSSFCASECMDSSGTDFITPEEATSWISVIKSAFSGVSNWLSAALELLAVLINFFIAVMVFAYLFAFALFFLGEMLLIVFFFYSEKNAIGGFTGWIMCHVTIALAILRVLVWFVQFCMSNFAWFIDTLKALFTSIPGVGWLIQR